MAQQLIPTKEGEKTGFNYAPDSALEQSSEVGPKQKDWNASEFSLKLPSIVFIVNILTTTFLRSTQIHSPFVIDFKRSERKHHIKCHAGEWAIVSFTFPSELRKSKKLNKQSRGQVEYTSSFFSLHNLFVSLCESLGCCSRELEMLSPLFSRFTSNRLMGQMNSMANWVILKVLIILT